MARVGSVNSTPVDALYHIVVAKPELLEQAVASDREDPESLGGSILHARDGSHLCEEGGEVLELVVDLVP